MEQHEAIHKSIKQLFLNNMLGGIAWGIGATLGASLILYILGVLLSRLDFIPIAGNFIIEVSEFVQQHSTR